MSVFITLFRFVIFLLVCKLVIRLYHFINYCITVNKIPGPISYPLSIFALPFEFLRVTKEDRFTKFYQLCQKYKNGIFRTSEAFDDVVVNIFKPELLEVILSSNKLITKAKLYEFLDPWFGEGMLTSTGDKWVQKRKTISPSFHFEILNGFSNIVLRKTKILEQVIDEKLKANPNKPMDFASLAIRFSFDTICETIMGVNLDVQKNFACDGYSDSAHKAGEILITRINSPWLQWDPIFFKTKLGDELKLAAKTINSFTAMLIKKKREARRVESKKMIGRDNSDDFEKRDKKPFLDLILDLQEKDKNFLNETELVEEVNTFLFGGYDTVAAGIGWVMFHLGNEPEIQEIVHQELDDIFGDSKEPATMNQVLELKYLERVIKESFRIHPPGPTVARRLTEDIELAGYQVPKETVVHLQILVMHRDPEVWPEPFKFDPDRFLPENIQDRHPYAFIPFSAGPRNCLGQNLAWVELRFVLSALLRKFRVKSLRKPEEMKEIWSATLLPFDGIPMYFIPK
ncbi:cytochrome P450 4c21-like isoform X1 [Leptopilina heterotoma]|uniref:cytochrome P450 4c21-like isoform X1 n=1 Tax=Leptopilina heterotoma TaxID=63436 RepID=UPI001CA89DBC|nr:cytochrome P450 4c21-like isoform X1 [Leptopilina heterotoma]